MTKHKFVETIVGNEILNELLGVIFSCKTCFKCKLSVIKRYENGAYFYYIAGKFIQCGWLGRMNLENTSCEEIIIKNIIE